MYLADERFISCYAKEAAECAAFGTGLSNTGFGIDLYFFQ